MRPMMDTFCTWILWAIPVLVWKLRTAAFVFAFKVLAVYLDIIESCWWENNRDILLKASLCAAGKGF